MKRYEITLDGQTFDVKVLSDPGKEQVEVEVDGQAFTAKVRAISVDEGPAAAAPSSTYTPRPATVPASTAPPPAPSSRAVVAPLPGIIKSIAVRPGQSVSIGDRLLVIEAMKMDNVIRAARKGIVEAVHVAEGHQVSHGELMLEYRN
jgi:biotin carboxyl carrier protein